MKTKDKIIELRKQGLTIPQISDELELGKGTIGYHLKDLNLKVKIKRVNSSETKSKISNSKLGKKQNRKNKFNVNSIDYWPILKGEIKQEGTYNNSIRGQIKRFIIRNNIINYICDNCKCNDQWMGKSMPLILDHINGIKDDNRLENLRFLCSNCDSIQDTYKGKNKNKNI
jgi:hypothetical protein